MNQLQYYRALVILNGAIPLAMLAWDAWRGQLGANAVNEALHISGLLSLIFLLLSLLMTPLRWVTGWGGWVAFRRSLGLYGFFYAILHLIIYIGFDRGLSLVSTAREIWMRSFLQIGAVAVLLMVPLAVTSTNAMIQRLGPNRWKKLHRIAYVVAGLAVLHYYLLVKSDVRQPLAFAGVLAVLLGGRMGRHYVELSQSSRKRQPPAKPLTGATNQVPTRAATPRKSLQPWKGELRVAAIFQETPDVKTFRLVSLDGGPLPFAYSPGQFLNLRLTIDGQRVNRSYTIASSPTRSHACELSIKREPLGRASRYMHDELKAGDTLQVSAPGGKFTFTGHEASGVVFITGGVGITPAMSIVRYLTDRAWSGEIFFLIVAKTERDLIFHDEIHWLRRRHPTLHVCQTLTRCDDESMWSGERGRATEALLRRFVPNLLQLPIYLCGPNEMMDATRALLMDMGTPTAHIKQEAFAARRADESPIEDAADAEDVAPPVVESPSALATPGIANSGFAINFSRSMLQTAAANETSVLEAAEAAEIDLPYDCRSGICGQCKVRLLSGSVFMGCQDALSHAERARGLILACQAIPQSDLVVDA